MDHANLLSHRQAWASVPHLELGIAAQKNEGRAGLYTQFRTLRDSINRRKRPRAKKMKFTCMASTVWCQNLDSIRICSQLSSLAGWVKWRTRSKCFHLTATYLRWTLIQEEACMHCLVYCAKEWMRPGHERVCAGVTLHLRCMQGRCTRMEKGTPFERPRKH